MNDVTAGALAFFSSPIGITFTGAVAALAVIVWDWRFALGALFTVQAAVGAATVHLYQTPAQWILIQTAVMGLSCIILGMSATQTMMSSPTARQAGSLSLRLMAVLLVYSGWRLLDIELTLPGIDSGVAQLYGWLAVCAMLMLALGANPLFGGVAFLLWIVPTQAFVATVLEIPSLVALLGILELLVALACSYLLMAERVPVSQKGQVLTDVAFPNQLPYVREQHDSGSLLGSIGSAVTRRKPDLERQGASPPRDAADETDAAPSGDGAVAAPEQQVTSQEGP